MIIDDVIWSIAVSIRPDDVINKQKIFAKLCYILSLPVGEIIIFQASVMTNFSINGKLWQRQGHVLCAMDAIWTGKKKVESQGERIDIWS